MGWTRMGRTDGRTDGQGGNYMLPRNFSGNIKMFLAHNCTLYVDYTCKVAFHTLIKCGSTCSIVI